MLKLTRIICAIMAVILALLLLIFKVSAEAEPATYAAVAIGYTVAENIAPEAQKRAEAEEKAEIEEPMDNDTDPLIYTGNFKITYYCACTYCCGPNACGITASGTKATEGRTVGADTSILPLGTHIYIEGMGELIVEDTGSAVKGNILDVFVDSHEKALKLGVDYKDVYVIER